MADEASGENKPVPKQEGQVINLIVKDQMGGEVHFKVKSHTKLEKVGAAGLLFLLDASPCTSAKVRAAAQVPLSSMRPSAFLVLLCFSTPTVGPW